MHIPSGASQTIDILSFTDALALSGRSGEYDARRWIYVPDFYTEYRYILGTRGDNPLICIGINPSTAEPDNLDNTLKSVSRIAGGNGFDSWIMFNVYAQRATRPDDMDRELNRELHEENMAAFRYILSNVAQGNMGGVGYDHRKAPLPPRLRARHGAHRRGIRRALALRRKALGKGSPASSSVPAQG